MLRATFLSLLLLQVTQHPIGTKLRLTAAPEAGWRFSGWAGTLSSPENPFEFVINSDVTITPSFIQESPTTATLTLNQAQGGSASVVVVPDVAPMLLGVIFHGSVLQSGSTVYRAEVAQAPEAGAALAVLVNVAPTGSVLSVSDGVEYAKAVEAISDDLSMWSVGRNGIYYRLGVDAQPRTITVTIGDVSAGNPHVRVTVVELRGVEGLGSVFGSRGAAGLPNPGSIMIDKPSIILSMTESSGGPPAAGAGNTLMSSASSFWFAGSQYRIEQEAGAYPTDFMAESGRWVAAAAAFEARQ